MSETIKTVKCVSAAKTILRKHREKSLPSLRKNEVKDIQNLPQTENNNISTDIKSGAIRKQVFNIEKVELDKPSHIQKVKQEKAKIEKARQKKAEAEKRARDKLDKLKKISKDIIKKRNEEKFNNVLPGSENKLSRVLGRSSEKFFNGFQCSQDKIKSSDQKKSFEHRLSNKIWQIMSHDLFPLDNDKFYSSLHASDSETKKYIISVVKRYNTKELKNQNRPQKTQTSEKSLRSNHNSGNRKQAIKRRVRRQLWQWTKNAIKRNEHWSKFLADNNIVVENINIDKFDLSLIDVDALGIENKLLKRTILWLFK